jgi:hypothetical protein
MSDVADKIYAATGLVLNAEAAAALERLIKQEKRKALLEAADLCDQLDEHGGGICAIAIREMAHEGEGNE